MDTLASAVLARVQSLVRDGEPRIVNVSSTAERTLLVDLSITHVAAFELNFASGVGRLPGSVRKVSSIDDLEIAGPERLATVNRDAAGLMRQWADRNADYRARLRPPDCLHEYPTLGVEVACDKCGGHGRTMCGYCNGHKQVTCATCGGRGRYPCQQCDGHGNRRCWTCHGSGYIEKQEFVLNNDERQQTMNQRGAMTVRVPCSACGAKGSTTCGSCWLGTVNCIPCGQSGKVNCPRCGASGTVPCDSCAATGVVHRTAAVSCTVSHGKTIGVDPNDAEDLQTLSNRVPFESLGTLGPLTLQQAGSAGTELTLRFRSTMVVESVDVARGAKHTHIRGYGPARNVFNHHGIVEDLLTSDLNDFETAVSRRFSVAGGGVAGLGQATQQFLASEINALIAAHHHLVGKEDTDRALEDPTAPLVAVDLVTRGYVQRAQAAIGKALPHIYGTMILPPALAIIATLALAGLATRYEHLTPWSVSVKILGLTCLAGIAWAIVELSVPRKLQQQLGAPLYERLGNQFGRIRRLSWVVAGCLLLGVAVGVGVAQLNAGKPALLTTGIPAVTGRAVLMTEVLHEALLLDVRTANAQGVRAALAPSARITVDRDIDKIGTHQLITEGPGSQRVIFIFDRDVLESVSVTRPAEPLGAGFDRRLRAIGAEMPLQKREKRFAFFQGPTIQVGLSEHDGVLTEFYQRLARR
jgi:hypothetical protein